MARKRKENISEVMFSYVGTDEQFDEFLKMLVHDYLSVDQPYTKLQNYCNESGENVISITIFRTTSRVY